MPTPPPPRDIADRTAAPHDESNPLAELRAVISAHPAVAEVSLRTETDPSVAGSERLVARIRPVATMDGPGADRARVDEWHLIYEWVYGELPGSGGLGENFVGWHSSYTGKPIPLTEMREWRDATVTRVRSLRPRRVLEIGVGTGLLLGWLAPQCEAYAGIDFSETVLDTLREQIAGTPELSDRVTLRTAEANDLSAFPDAAFDTVIINSVAQYFPDGDYLADVLEEAVRVLTPGGAMFVGDVRNRRLLRAFRTAVLAEEVAGAMDSASARFLVERSALEEKELLVDPGFFSMFRDRVPQVAAVDVRLKRAVHHNELSRHRYDVVLRKAPVPGPEPVARSLTWGTDVSDLATLRAHLQRRSGPLRIRGVENCRVAQEVAALRALDRGQLQPIGVAVPPGAGRDPDPEEFHRLGEELGYLTAVTWADGGAPELIDVLFGAQAGAEPAVPPGVVRLAELANNPATAGRTTAFVTALREDLLDHLPADRLPHTFVIVQGTTEGN